MEARLSSMLQVYSDEIFWTVLICYRIRFDTPANLLQREGGVLHELAKKSGEFEELLSLATEE